MKTAFDLPVDQSCGIFGYSDPASTPSSSNTKSSATQLYGEEISCESSKFQSAARASKAPEAGHLSLGGARSWSCSEGTLGPATGLALIKPTKGSSGRPSRKGSLDLADCQSGQVQSNEAQKRKWEAVKRERAALEMDVVDPAFGLPDARETWEEDIIARRIEEKFAVKTEQSDAVVGPMQRSQSMKSPIGRKGSAARNRTSRYIGVGSSNRKNQWQARILVHGKVTHLGYYQSEEEAAMIYDRVAVSLNGPEATTNFPAKAYMQSGGGEFFGLGREDLQRALGVKPMDKSSRFRGVSRKKGKWEAKVMVNRKWAYRALFDSEDEAAHAYDAAVRRLKPREASSFVNFGIEEGRKRSSELAPPPASRSKSQKLKPKTSKQVLKRQPNSFPDMLVLEEGHIPLTCVDLEAPSTPKRQASLQHPHSPVSGSTRATMASSVLPSSLYNELSSSASFTTETLPLTLHSATNSPISKRCSSMGQLSVTLPPPSALLLPDPNSIGVPPPDNLPFPELVKTPFSSATDAESALRRHPSCAMLQSHFSSQSGLPNTLSQASSLHSSLTLPEIPMPLLEPAAEAAPETLGLAPESYFTSTPLPQQLAAALAQSQHTHRQEQAQEAKTPQNPFQEASKLLPPISGKPSTLTPTGSGTFLPPLHPRTGSLKTLKSMPEGEYLKAAPPAPTQPFAHPPMPRASSEGLDPMMLGRPLRAAGSSVHFDLMDGVIPGHESITCGLPEESLPLGPPLGMSLVQDFSSNESSVLSNRAAMQGEKRSLYRSMSALPSLPQLMRDEDAVGTTAGHKVGSLDPGVAPSSNSQRHSELEVIGDNATELLDDLLRENIVPTDSQGVQIGGEFLHSFEPLDMIDNAYIIGRT